MAIFEPQTRGFSLLALNQLGEAGRAGQTAQRYDLMALQQERYDQARFEAALANWKQMRMQKKAEDKQSNTGTMIGTGVGATAGFIVGGPPGAAMGAGLGAQVGGGFDTPRRSPEQGQGFAQAGAWLAEQPMMLETNDIWFRGGGVSAPRGMP